MAKKTLNIEIGDQLSNVCVTTRRGKTVLVSKSFHFPTPRGAVSDGEILDAEVLGEQLHNQLRIHGVDKIKNVIFVMNSAKIVSRKVNLPPVKENRIKALIQSNVKEYFPIDLSGYEVAHTKLETPKGSAAGVCVLVTVAPRKLLKSYQPLIDSEEFNLVAFDYTANSQLCMYKALAEKGVVMHVGISAKRTLVTFMMNGMLQFQRSFLLGADELVSDVMHAENIPYDEALLLVKSGEWIAKGNNEEIYKDFLDRFQDGVTRSLDFYKSTYGDSPVDQIVLAECGAEIFGLKDAVANVTTLPVKLLSEVANIKKVASAENVTFYVSCIGSAIEPLDLIPEEMKSAQKKKQNSNETLTLPILLFILATLLGGVLAGKEYLALKAKEAELANMEARQEELAYVQEEYEAYVTYDQMRYNFEVLEREGVNQNAGLREFLEELELKMPAELLVLSATCDELGVSMSIEVPTMDEVAVVMSQLRKFETIESLVVSQISEDKNDLTGDTLTSFSVSCTYVTPEPIEEPAKMAE